MQNVNNNNQNKNVVFVNNHSVEKINVFNETKKKNISVILTRGGRVVHERYFFYIFVCNSL